MSVSTRARVTYEGVLEHVSTSEWAVPEAMTQLDFVRYAGASGDFNPIHLDEDHARVAGYPSVFGQGMYTAGLLSRFTTAWLGLGSTTRFGVRFKRQLFPGDELTCTGRVLSHDDSTRSVEVELAVTNQRGEVLVEGQARAVLPARPDAD
jgi:acyl dehydratase